MGGSHGPRLSIHGRRVFVFSSRLPSRRCRRAGDRLIRSSRRQRHHRTPVRPTASTIMAGREWVRRARSRSAIRSAIDPRNGDYRQEGRHAAARARKRRPGDFSGRGLTSGTRGPTARHECLQRFLRLPGDEAIPGLSVKARAQVCPRRQPRASRDRLDRRCHDRTIHGRAPNSRSIATQPGARRDRRAHVGRSSCNPL